MNEWLPNHTKHKHTAFVGAAFQLTISSHKKSIFGRLHNQCFRWIYCSLTKEHRFNICYTCLAQVLKVY